jgi:hypothetical protein
MKKKKSATQTHTNIQEKTHNKTTPATSEETIYTKEDFLKALRKVTRPISPKSKPVKAGTKTSE